MEVTPDGLSRLAAYDGGKGVRGCLLYVAQTAEVGEEALARQLADSLDVEQFGVAIAHGAALAMITDGKPMALVADPLHEMENG